MEYYINPLGYTQTFINSPVQDDFTLISHQELRSRHAILAPPNKATGLEGAQFVEDGNSITARCWETSNCILFKDFNSFKKTSLVRLSWLIYLFDSLN